MFYTFLCTSLFLSFPPSQYHNKKGQLTYQAKMLTTGAVEHIHAYVLHHMTTAQYGWSLAVPVVFQIALMCYKYLFLLCLPLLFPPFLLHPSSSFPPSLPPSCSSLENCPTDTTLADDPYGLRVDLMTHQKRALAWLEWRETQTPSGGILGERGGGREG